MSIIALIPALFCLNILADWTHGLGLGGGWLQETPTNTTDLERTAIIPST